MLVLIVVAAIVILVVVTFLAMGRGGGLSAERNDYLPLDLGPVSATDVALLRPPAGLWGYNMQATDDAMEQIAESIRERDVRIVALEQLVTDLSRDHAPMPPLASPYAGARHRRLSAGTVETEAAQAPRDTTLLDSAPPDSAPPPFDAAATESARSPFDAAATESARLPFDAPAGESVRLPFDAAATESARLPFDAPAGESVRLPFELPKPSGDASAPPERSHD